MKGTIGEGVDMPGGPACWMVAAAFLAGFLVLAVRLERMQMDYVAESRRRMAAQSERRVLTDAPRGCILAKGGAVLAGNRPTASIAVSAESFQKRKWADTAAGMRAAIDSAAAIVGRPSAVTDREILRHLKQTLARPLVVWRDVSADELARFSEHELDLPGFICVDGEERVYPQGSLAAHLVGYVGRDRAESVAGDEAFRFCDLEMRGRSGVEYGYDSFLRGVAGEKRLLVDARGYAYEETTVREAKRGPDLCLALDLGIQAAAEAQLAGERGACVVMDADTGEVLAFASAPAFNPNEFVPTLRQAVYDRFANDPAKPLLNRASGGSYAPGSTFKPITALAGIHAGISPLATYECTGHYQCGQMKIRCSRTWGHGEMNVMTALRDSCNPYFCHLGTAAGTNAVISAARAFALGAKTGIDYPIDLSGVVPDDAWKREKYSERWYPGDLAQMSMGQGMLLATPLQMARVAGAIGTGFLVTPRLIAAQAPERRRLPFTEAELRPVREGMRMVVVGGTGKKGAEGVDASVIGKTGTAEVGRGETRRKNTWFIAFAEKGSRRIAVSMVIENGESGGGTTAPKVCEVLKAIFGTCDGEAHLRGSGDFGNIPTVGEGDVVWRNSTTALQNLQIQGEKG